MLPESIENILGFSRKRVIEIYDYIVMIGGLIILISMSLRNLFLVWTSRFGVVTTPVYAATPQFLCWPFL